MIMLPICDKSKGNGKEVTRKKQQVPWQAGEYNLAFTYLELIAFMVPWVFKTASLKAADHKPPLPTDTIFFPNIRPHEWNPLAEN